MLHFPIPMLLGGATPPGQQQWATPGTYSFEVPPGVTRLWALVVGGGGGGATGSVSAGRRSGAGAGGGLAYCALIVTPGETLTVIVGAGGAYGASLNAPGGTGQTTRIQRAGSDIVRATGGVGGRTDALPTWADGGAGVMIPGQYDGLLSNAVQTGGRGGYGEPDSAQTGGGGGAAGYAGSGGDGTEFNGNGYPAAAGSGGGGGGPTQRGGGGVGLLGKGADGAGGVYPNGGRGGSGGADGTSAGGSFGGGGAVDNGGANGAARVFWGGDRSYPSNAPNV